jgi:hypothetical protein
MRSRKSVLKAVCIAACGDAIALTRSPLAGNERIVEPGNCGQVVFRT